MPSKSKLVDVVGALCAAFGRTPTATTFAAYEMGLDGLTDEQLEFAGKRSLQNASGFMPTPGQLRQVAVTGGTSYEGRAEIAWLEFDRAVCRHGGDYSVTFADGLINATVRLCGGWIANCEKGGEDYFVWLQRQFKETYVRLCQSGTTPEQRCGFAGRLEMQNAANGLTQNRLNAYTGQPVTIATTQPVIAPPTVAAIENRPANIPRVEFHKVN